MCMQIVLATTLDSHIKCIELYIDVSMYIVCAYMIYKTISNWLIVARYQDSEGNNKEMTRKQKKTKSKKQKTKNKTTNKKSH